MIYETLKTLFDHIFKYLEVHQINSATHHIFNSPFGVSKCSQIRSFMFDILHYILSTVPLKLSLLFIYNWLSFCWCHFVSFVMHIYDAKFQEHCSNISRECCLLSTVIVFLMGNTP